MLIIDPNPSEYLVTEKDFEDAKFQWRVSSEVPLRISASVAGGLILVTKEREMWYQEADGRDRTLWTVKFYTNGDENHVFWFSKNGGDIGDMEIHYLNINLMRRIGEIEWQQIKK